MKIIAHRGASGLAPENTIAAFQKALEIGVDMIELDIRPTRDGGIVVFHDKLLNRTTPFTGRVNQHDLTDLQQINAGHWFSSEFLTEGIPSLDDTLEFIDGRCELLIEIKSSRGEITPYFLKRLCQTIYRHNALDWVIVQSFDTRMLDMIHRIDPGIRLHKLIVFKIPLLALQFDQRIQLENILSKKHYQGINVDYHFITPALLKKIRKRGKSIFCWTVNERKQMQRMINLKVDGIITNYPHKLKEMLETVRR